jgi:ankyrin repeat protein
VAARLRAVVAEQLWAAQAAQAAPAPPPPAAAVGDVGPATLNLRAVLEDDGAAVPRLLAAGADPNASVAGRNPLGAVVQSTALCVAAGCGRVEAVRQLLDAGADRARSHCRVALPLIHFIPDSLTYSMSLFLKRQCDRTLGADPELADDDGPTPLMLAAQEGQLEVCRNNE